MNKTYSEMAKELEEMERERDALKELQSRLCTKELLDAVVAERDHLQADLDAVQKKLGEIEKWCKERQGTRVAYELLSRFFPEKEGK